MSHHGVPSHLPFRVVSEHDVFFLVNVTVNRNVNVHVHFHVHVHILNYVQDGHANAHVHHAL